LLDLHRPVLDFGLACPQCGYLLTGLMGNRCPECGEAFSVRDIIEDLESGRVLGTPDLADPADHHLPRRAPVLTGNERPLPELGLGCAECGHPLAGAIADTCPGCGAPFDLAALEGEGTWLDVSQFVPPRLQMIAKTILYGDQIPYLMDNASLDELYGGVVPLLKRRLRVPRAFFFDALHALATAQQSASQASSDPWICPECGEDVPAGFEVCWSCGSECPDLPIEPDQPEVEGEPT
jgi:predicted amidophosphoribosyltransferase